MAQRRQLARLALEVRDRLESLVSDVDTSNIDTWWQSVQTQAIALVLRGANAAATLTQQYIRQHAAVEGRLVIPSRAVPERSVVGASLRITGPVAFKIHMSSSGGAVAQSVDVMKDQLFAAAMRQTMNGARGTLVQTFFDSDQVAGYRRVTDADPCFFCALLASRGAVYTKESATTVVGRGGRPRGSRQIGESYHDHCQCTAELVYTREQEPPEVAELYQDWLRVTRGLSGQDAINAWRRYWENR